LSKCEFYGFKGKINALLRSYLSDRYQRVLINNPILLVLQAWVSLGLNNQFPLLPIFCLLRPLLS
jgi:hypothetical protein